MKGLAVLGAVLAMLPVSAMAADYAWPVVRVVDGDTVAVDASADMPPELAAVKIRLRGVDTPEKGGRADCDEEREAAKAATAFTQAAIERASTIMVRNPEWGSFGRVLADLMLDGQSLSDSLLKAGHAHVYKKGSSLSWCPQAQSQQ